MNYQRAHIAYQKQGKLFKDLLLYGKCIHIIKIWQLAFRLKAHLQTPKSMANEYISQTWLN